MRKKLTLMVDAEIYEGLRKTIGPRKISKFVEELVKPYVIQPNLEAAYSEMSRDKAREKEAANWAELAFLDVNDETR